MENKDQIESIDLKDAYKAAILKLILDSIKAKYGDEITTVWPIPQVYFGLLLNFEPDFTKAYLIFNPDEFDEYEFDESQLSIIGNTDIILHFQSPTKLSVSSLKEVNISANQTKRYYETKEFPIANPQIHSDVIKSIVPIIDKALL